MGRLAGKVALITGGASGIGRAAALLFAREGARIMIATSHNAVGARATANEIAAAGGTAAHVLGDVARAEDARRVVAATVEAYGRLDVLLNNAGITIPGSYTHDVRDDDWARIIAVDLTGAFLMMKHAIPAMLQGGGGSVVNVSSALALAGIPGCSAYAAAKAGLIGLTRTAAIEYAQQGIRVNILLPGFIWTPMHQAADPAAADPAQPPTSEYYAFVANTVEPMGRWGSAEEVAQTALFLAADESSYVTGSTLAVDGGLLAR
ncbi:MAG TPA: SDR family NAD(P)-dependent oxidoreductase [Chloroflexota bacterium]|jgi:NAD(P)-dependent dehydrogenase (short-subunit alcohol dehydrogenase family)